MNKIAIYERLIHAGEVHAHLANEYDRQKLYSEYAECKRVALETLLARLRDGYASAWTTLSHTLKKL